MGVVGNPLPLSGLIAPRHRLADEAYEALKNMIMANELEGGTVISVLAMAERLGVSRSPVKEAILGLEQDGFVVCEPFKAPRVMTITPKFIRDIYGVRIALESQAAAASTSALSDDDLAALGNKADALSAAMRSGSINAVTEFDSELHRLLVARADNEVLTGYLATLEHHLVRLRNVYGQHIFSQSELEAQVEELQGIVAAAMARDAGRIEAAMKAHLSRHAERLIARIEEEG
jgi:DNA-binding GntR family transcriptional regulator